MIFLNGRSELMIHYAAATRENSARESILSKIILTSLLDSSIEPEQDAGAAVE